MTSKDRDGDSGGFYFFFRARAWHPASFSPVPAFLRDPLGHYESKYRQRSLSRAWNSGRCPSNHTVRGRRRLLRFGFIRGLHSSGTFAGVKSTTKQCLRRPSWRSSLIKPLSSNLANACSQCGNSQLCMRCLSCRLPIPPYLFRKPRILTATDKTGLGWLIFDRLGTGKFDRSAGRSSRGRVPIGCRTAGISAASGPPHLGHHPRACDSSTSNPQRTHLISISFSPR